MNKRKIFGEVFSPVKLVNEMLDTLPNEVWTDPDLKWLDPCVGSNGIFALTIYQRLMNSLTTIDLEVREEHILTNMIYVVEIQQDSCLEVVKLFSRLNLYNGSFLEEGFDKHMKEVWELDGFDLVVGNPPYQHPTNKRWKLWVSFLDKISKMNNKYLLFITPIAWMNGEGEELNNAKNIINNKGITYINIDCNEYFNVGEKIGYYLCNGDKNDEVIISNMGKEIKIKNNGKFLLDDISILKDSIFNKMKSDVKFNFLNINTDIKSKINNGTFSRDKTEKNNTRVIHSASNIFYCSEDFLDLKKEGVIVNWSGHFYKKNDSKYLFRSIEDVPGRNTKKILTNNKNESDNLIGYISSKLIRFYVNSKKTSGFNTPLFDIPKVDLSKSWTDKELYDHFDLTEEEIQLIEETIQETTNKNKLKQWVTTKEKTG